VKSLVFPIHFRDSVNGPVPADEKLHAMTMEFCERELSDKVNLLDYKKVWVSAQVDADDKPVKITGIQCLDQVIDLPVSRYTDSKAAHLLSGRVDSYLADQGFRGASVFVYISDSEKPEQRCRNWASWLSFWKAKPAQRWMVRVR
jgi:hypothetical protein